MSSLIYMKVLMDYVEGQNKNKTYICLMQDHLYVLPNILPCICVSIQIITFLFSLFRSKYFEIISLSSCFYCIFRIFRRSCQTPFEACGVTVFSDILLHLICLNESKLEMSCTKIQKDLSIITSTS